MRIFFIILFFSYFSNAHAQESENEYKKLIDSAIRLKVKNLVEFNNGINLKKNKVDFSNQYIITENDLSYIYFSPEQGIEFKSMNIYDKKNKRILKKGIEAWKFFVTLKNNRLTINIIEFNIIYKSEHYNCINRGSTIVIFEYSCEKKKWIQAEFKNSRD